MNYHTNYLKTLIDRGGPNEEDYYDLDAWIIEITEQVKIGVLGKSDINELIDLFGDAFSEETMQGFAFKKPHGYAGDFEIIDRIYQGYMSSHPHFKKWDIYWQSHAAACAVRNRVNYLYDLLNNIGIRNSAGRLEVLNLASGPGRDLLNYFDNAPETNIHLDCIEQDSNAIDYASELCKQYIDKITFIKQNALKFSTSKKYMLIWSAGLFDYFDDKVFSFMLEKLSTMLDPNGEIVIGNFSTMNPSKPYMELFEWNLHHRSPSTLKELAIASGFKEKNIEIRKEETGVNLFLHLRNAI